MHEMSRKTHAVVLWMKMRIWQRNTCVTMSRLIVDGLVLGFWIGLILIVHIRVKPRRLGFFCDDDSIKYPYVKSTVSDDVIVSVTLVIPVVIMLATELLSRNYFRHRVGPAAAAKRRGADSAHTDHPALKNVAAVYLTYFWGYLVLTLTVLMLKVTTGQLRPHFLAVCRPDVDWVTCKGYVAQYNCTNTEVTQTAIEAARQSFPSGHAAYATYMALFGILYMEMRLKTRHRSLLRLTSYAVLTSYALWCGATRVSDYKHHMHDVMAGGLLGLCAAAVAFTLGALPSLHHPRTSPPPPPPSPDIESGHHPTTTTTNNNNNNDADSAAEDQKSVTTSHIIIDDDFDDDDDDDDDSDDDEDGALTSLESDVPGTPTPLLQHCGTQRPLAGTKGPRTARLFTLEGDKHRFARKKSGSSSLC